CMTFAFFYRASLGGPDERREQKFATLVGESFRNVTHKYFTHTNVESSAGLALGASRGKGKRNFPSLGTKKGCKKRLIYSSYMVT
ncbi:hypothetical protein, partial [Geobacillus stearothermophilus]|uniref:hypothetical protein n=1 Tax=Geobacillus stearothermophilus TaxID=1422 RepID=UPI001C7CE5D8